MMTELREIGGFFGLEMPVFDNFPQAGGVMLGSGRQALEYILRGMGTVKRLYVPYYTCPTVYEPMTGLNVEPVFYHVNERLEPEETPRLGEGEFFLYTNYFGIKERCADALAALYGGRLIVDNALALYSPRREVSSALYSPRKWCGVPDGGVAVSAGRAMPVVGAEESAERAVFLLECAANGVEAAAEACERNEARLHGAPMRAMSRLSQFLLKGIDFKELARRRRENFFFLHERLGHLNRLNIDMASIAVPYCYPFWTSFPALRDALIDRRILFPVLWHEVLEVAPADGVETKLAMGLLPLPIDQRWGREDMERIARTVEKWYGLS